MGLFAFLSRLFVPERLETSLRDRRFELICAGVLTLLAIVRLFDVAAEKTNKAVVRRLRPVSFVPIVLFTALSPGTTNLFAVVADVGDRPYIQLFDKETKRRAWRSYASCLHRRSLSGRYGERRMIMRDLGFDAKVRARILQEFGKRHVTIGDLERFFLLAAVERSGGEKALDQEEEDRRSCGRFLEFMDAAIPPHVQRITPTGSKPPAPPPRS
jgi:hypothetical protein